MGAEPWFKEGLRFGCTQCGHCCTGEPGFTWISELEIAALCTRLGMSDAAFRQRYTRTVFRAGQQQVSLVDKPDHECVFFRRGVGCTVYEDRPKQCRTWPFWRTNVRERADWDAAAESCPGMNRGPRSDAPTIERIAADDGLPG